MTDLRARGLDVSENQPPAKMRFGEWRTDPGLCFAWYRASIGQHTDPTGPVHGAALRGADYLTGSYHALRGDVDRADQARRFHGLLHPGDRLPPALDIERPELTRTMVLAFLDAWLALDGPPMTCYSSQKSWREIMGPQPLPPDLRQSFALGWVAGYPFDTPAGQPVPMDPVAVELRSTPPTSRVPALLDPWEWWEVWQHSGQGSLPGYPKFIDLDVYNGTEAELRQRFSGATTMQYIVDVKPGTTTQQVRDRLADVMTGFGLVVPIEMTPAPPPITDPLKDKTNQFIINLFSKAFGPQAYIAKLSAALPPAVFANRQALYTGPTIVDMPGLTAADKQKLIDALALM